MNLRKLVLYLFKFRIATGIANVSYTQVSGRLYFGAICFFFSCEYKIGVFVYKVINFNNTSVNEHFLHLLKNCTVLFICNFFLIDILNENSTSLIESF